jgi:hypothetical protein
MMPTDFSTAILRVNKTSLQWNDQLAFGGYTGDPIRTEAVGSTGDLIQLTDGNDHHPRGSEPYGVHVIPRSCNGSSEAGDLQPGRQSNT